MNIESEIQRKGLNAPRVTPAMLDAAILTTQFHVFPGTMLTVACLTLKNGFNVTGESACASPENFDEKLGRQIAFEDAKRKIWALEGYLLKQRLWLANHAEKLKDYWAAQDKLKATQMQAIPGTDADSAVIGLDDEDAAEYPVGLKPTEDRSTDGIAGAIEDASRD